MNILLIVPPFGEIYNSYRHLYRRGFLNPPLSLAYLGGALVKAGQNVRIIDGEAEGLSVRQLMYRIMEFSPDLIGLSCTSVDFELAERLSVLIKTKFPDVRIVIGGTHLNIFGSQVLRDAPVFDFGCIGDGEDLIVELASAIEEGNSTGFANIAGLVYWQDDDVIQNSYRPVELNIDRYPFPQRQLLRNVLYCRSVPFRGYTTTAAMMSSRGCPFSCVYCAAKNIYGGTRVRLRSVENVLEELDDVVKRLGIGHVAFNDDCLTLNRKRIIALCEGIREHELKFTWEGLSRADLLDKELVYVMKEAGLVRMSIGIESGNPDILKIIQKGERLEQISEALNLVSQAGIVTRGSVIIGYPYETRQTIEDTFNFITKIKGLDQVVVNILQPYPGTKVREMVLRGEGGSRFIGNTDSSERLQRFGRASVAVNDLSPSRLVRLQRSGFLRFYLRPKTIFKNLKISGWKPFISDSFGFLRSVFLPTRADNEIHG